MKTTFFFLSTLFAIPAFAQEDTISSPWSINGYAEVYYAYDFANPDNHTRPGFVYSMNRHNEFNLNLGFVRAAYATDNVRGNLAIMAGTYANANLAAEPATLRNIYEANLGIKLSNTANLWLDGGIFGSHIGFESAIGKDCWTVTRSILADNSPYFESGAKLTYTTDDGRWTISGLALNGWQRIQRVDGNQTIGFGHQLVFKPSDRITLNSSSFIGNDKPDDVKQTRFFHNFYGIFQVSDAVGITVGFDYGSEEAAAPVDDNYSWFSPVVILRYGFAPGWNVALRGEYYQDENGVIFFTGTPNGFKTMGYSVNLDHWLNDQALWRIELRGFSSEDEIFQDSDGEPTKSNLLVTTAVALSF
jgi:hypothetical protein